MSNVLSFLIMSVSMVSSVDRVCIKVKSFARDFVAYSPNLNVSLNSFTFSETSYFFKYAYN